MVTNALEEMALSYHRNTEEQDDICEKHKIQLIKILRTNDVLCRLCESERIHSENQIKVNKLVDAEHERERKFYLERFSLYDDVLKNATLDNFDTPTEKETEKLKFAKKICREWASGARNNVVFQGEAGTGKSHLAFAMMKALSETTKEIAIFINVTDLLMKIKADFSQEEFLVNKIASAKFLVLDDLGMEKDSDWSFGILYNILNKRANTIITTNLTAQEIQKRYGRPFMSRLMKGVDNEHLMVFNDLKNKRKDYF
jgi:gp21|nr:MAG TPA: Replicative helicase [Caudoviricetes sp.]